MMREKTTNIILREGFKPLFFIVIALGIFAILDWGIFALISFFFLALGVIFFLNPEREPEEEDEYTIIAPIDGKIKKIEPREDGVNIFIGNFFLDPHVVRSPFNGNIEKIETRGGLFLPLSNENAKKLNQKSQITFKKDNEKYSLSLLNANFNFMNSFYVKENSYISTSKRVGFFPSGEAIFSCPKNVDLKVSTGDNLKAGETLIGSIVK